MAETPLQRHWWLIRSMLLVAGVSIAAASSAFLLVGGWGDTHPPSAAAYRAEPPATPPASVALTTVEDAVPGEQATPAPQSPTNGSPTETDARDQAITSTPTAFVASVPTAAPPSVGRVSTVSRPVATSTPVPPLPPAATSTPRSTSTPRPTSTPVPPAPSCPNAGLSTYAAIMHDALNAERAAYGLPSLGNVGCVNYIAQTRAEDMAALNYFAHTSPSGVTAFSLLDEYRVPHGWAGENLARNNYPDDQTVAVAVRDLMASEGHRRNILNTNFTHIGVAAAFDGVGMYYFAMIYIGVP